MKIFISWSGEKSREIADAFREWLPSVIQFTEPFMSRRDILAGERGTNKISHSLEAANYGVICLTPSNLNAPWILFEAGALSKQVEVSKVTPMLMGLTTKNVEPPLNDFQMKLWDKDGVWELLLSILAASDNDDRADKYNLTFQSMWPILEDKLSKIKLENEAQERTDRSLLEEILDHVKAAPKGSDRHAVTPRRGLFDIGGLALNELNSGVDSDLTTSLVDALMKQKMNSDSDDSNSD